MAIQQLKDLQTWSVQFHHSLAEQYGEMAQTHSQPRMRMMLDYLAEHEREIERGLQRHLENQEDAARSQWLRTGTELETPNLLEQQRAELCCNSEDELLDKAVQIHQQLRQMYADLAQEAELPESQAYLVALRDHEEAETRRLVRDVGRFDMC